MDFASFLPFIIGSGIGFSIGIFLGKRLERLDWNRLIKEGKIPAPKHHD